MRLAKMVQVVMCVLLLAGLASAQISVYNNFAADHDGWDYTYNTGWTVAGDNVDPQFGVEQAMLFESVGAGYVSDIWVGFFYVPSSSYADTVTMRLVANPYGLPPDTFEVLEEWVLTEFTSWNQWDPPIHLEGLGTTWIDSGATYWLWASAKDLTWTGWCMNSDHTLTCPHTLRREGEDWLTINDETASAFRVDVFEENSIEESECLAETYQVLSAYPNPFNPSTTLSYTIDTPGQITLRVFDMLGREVTVLEHGYRSAGRYSHLFSGENLPSGTYFAVLQTESNMTTTRIMLIK